MHVYEEDAECRSDSVIECLSWMRCVDTADQRHFLHVNNNPTQQQASDTHENDTDTDNDSNNNQQVTVAAFGDDPHESTLRRAYQQASFDCGWLACGNARCIVSITQTQLLSRSNDSPDSDFLKLLRPNTTVSSTPSDAPDAARTNFNLWGHKHKVIHVRWNEPYQKLASCSQNGVIFVWVKHDGRWSIELINDRNQQVSDFRWSYDGRLALITYADGFVLVGNVNGQRHWSTMLPLRAGAEQHAEASNANCNAAEQPVRLTCGIWTPRNKRVLFGTSAGHLLVVSAQTGHIIADYPVRGARFGIVQLEWNCAAWHLVDEAARPRPANDRHNLSPLRPSDDAAHDDADGYTLACALSNGDVLLLRNADPDETVRTIETRLERVRLAFSRDGCLLAACGRVSELSERKQCDFGDAGDAVLRFYTTPGELVRSYTLLSRNNARRRNDDDDAMSRANAVCWAHDDARVFVACGCHVRTFWIRMSMSPLTALTCIAIRRAIGCRRAVCRLPLPGALQRSVDHYFAATIRSRSRLPTARSLREFVCSPPASRLFCTMKRVASNAHPRAANEPDGECKAASGDSLSPDVCYVLYLEFLGGLIPLLKAKRSSRFRLDFVIFDPLSDAGCEPLSTVDPCSTASHTYCTDCQRLRTRDSPRPRPLADASLPSYDEAALREHCPLAAVVANLWGTKFRVCGLQPFVPKALGTVQYKPSLFHLQPRKMTVTVAELNPDTLLLQLARRCTRTAADRTRPARHCSRTGSSELQSSRIVSESAFCDAQLSQLQTDQLHSIDESNCSRKSRTVDADSEQDELEHIDAVVDFARIKMIDLDNALTQDSPASRFGTVADDDEDDEDVSMYIDECITVDVTDVQLGRREQLAQLRNDVTPTWPKQASAFLDDRNRPSISALDSFTERCGSPSRCLVAPIAPSETLGSLASTSASPAFLLDQPARTTEPEAEASFPASNALACAPGSQQRTCCSETSDDLGRHGSKECGLLRRLIRRCPAGNSPSSSKWVESSLHGDTVTHWLSVPPRTNTTSSRSAPTTPTHCATAQNRLAHVSGPRAAVESCSSSTSASQRRTSTHKQDESVAWRLASLLTPKLVRRRRCHSQQVAENSHLSALCTPRMGNKARLAKRASLERCCACGKSLTVTKASPHRAADSDEHRPAASDPPVDDSSAREAESSPNGGGGGNVVRRKSAGETGTNRCRSTKLGRKSKVHDGAQPNAMDASDSQRVHVMHNKEPIWNELSQVYQLDFGGRVTQESAKNFQIEFNGEQVLQFGRIGNDSFTLDFQHPFSPIQAFGVALANITQRLK